MKRLGRYIWFAFTVAIIVMLVLFNLDAVRSFLTHLLVYFARLPLISRIFIGFVTWLVSVIAPGFLFWYLFRPPENDEDETGGLGHLLLFLIIWPPGWPIALILWIILKYREYWQR